MCCTSAPFPLGYVLLSILTSLEWFGLIGCSNCYWKTHRDPPIPDSLMGSGKTQLAPERWPSIGLKGTKHWIGTWYGFLDDV
ncbi:hypothetical protein HanRHA438_Chr16g0760761 [Helianthus annuus]|nr:hypothetical protein HanRHA438_Chr16g0760761 [Helianthus annuus]